jgi:hypothetical protein
MDLMRHGQHAAPQRPPEVPGRIARLASAICGLLKAPASAEAQKRVDAALAGCSDGDYDTAWAMIQPGRAPEALTTADPPARAKSPRPARSLVIAAFVVLLASGLGALAAAASYDTVSHLAAAKGVALPRLTPVGIDGGLAGVILLDIVATWLAEPIWWLRMTARLFAAGTIAANAAAGWPDLTGAALRIGAPVLFVVLVEAGRTLLLRGKKADERKRKAAARQARRGDRIPRVRWLLDFKGTLAMWRRMRLWRESSYAKAVTMELERVAAIEKLGMEYGAEEWKAKAPADLVWMLTSGVRMTEALGRVGELLAGEERERSAVAGLRREREALRGLRARAEAEAADVAGMRTAIDRLRADLTAERAAREEDRAEAALALDRAVKAARAETRKPRARAGKPRAREVAPAQDDMANELRALMEFRDDPTLLGERKGGKLAEKLGVHPSTGRRLHARMVEGGQLKPEYAKMAAPLAGGAENREQ